MNRKLCKWKGIFFLLMLFFLLFGGNKQVSAASAKCKVVFANARGVVSTPTYKSWERTVKPGQWINLAGVFMVRIQMLLGREVG